MEQWSSLCLKQSDFNDVALCGKNGAALIVVPAQASCVASGFP